MSRRDNVFSCVRVPVVCRATFAANPFSYSQTCSTFRTAGGNDPAARTSLGCVVFIDYLEDDTGLMALVFQHRLYGKISYGQDDVECSDWHTDSVMGLIAMEEALHLHLHRYRHHRQRFLTRCDGRCEGPP